jgi:glycosyltransferase involved in cell wall biosynthesis
VCTILKALLSAVVTPMVPVLLVIEWIRVAAGGRKLPQGTVLFSFSQVMWDEVWQRPQEFASRSAERLSVVYCSPVQIHDWLLNLKGRWSSARTLTKNRNLVVLSPLVFSGHYRSHLIFQVNCWILSAYVRMWLKSASTIHAVANTPFGEPVTHEVLFDCGKRNPRLRCLAYDMIDDFTAFAWSPSWGSELEARLRRKADVVFTGTGELRDSIQVLRPDVEFIPCGVDFELFNLPAKAVPPELARMPRPLIGYFGSISERLDLELIAAIARKFPDASLVFIGPVHLAPDALPRAQNIHYLGLKSHDELAAYAQAFSVALIPFKLTDATVKLNPVKTLEYLATGVPVVSSRIPDVERFFSEAVAVAGSREQFVQLVGEALSSPDVRRRSIGLELARNASWGRMVSRMHERLGIESRPGELPCA